MGLNIHLLPKHEPTDIGINPGKSALHLSASTVNGLKNKPLNGNLTIDGHDHYYTVSL